MEKGEFIVEEEQLSVQAGVPRREQCLVCGKPIFLAERLKVAEKFYHRRCLKCARCQTQLTLGSFYETEVDGQFCCETCPDEEVRVGGSDDDEETVDVIDEIGERERAEQHQRLAAEEEKRISSLISNRLAMFERKPDPSGGGEGSATRPNWRNSSLSDEQKSRSMKNFLKSSTEADDEEMAPPPPLPSNAPPEVRKEVETVEIQAKSPVIEKEVILREKEEEEKRTDELRESQSVSNIREMFEKKGSTRTRSGEKSSMAVAGVGVISSSSEEKRDEIPGVEESEGKNGKEVPSDSSRHDTDSLSDPIEEKKDKHSEECPDNIDNKEMKEEPQLITQVSTKDEISPQSNDSIATETVSSSLKPAHSQEFVLEEPKEAELKTPADEIDTEKPRKNDQEDVAVPQEKTGEEIEQNIESSATKESDQIKEPSLELRTRSREEEEEELEQVSVVTKEEDQRKVDQPIVANHKEEEVESGTSGDKHRNSNEIATDKVPLKEQEEEDEKTVESCDTNQYPLDLNPFGSDGEDQGVMNKSVDMTKCYNPNLNPFGEEEDAGEEEKIRVVYRKPEKKRISTNPFGSDDEEETKSETAKKITPVPTPRRTIQSQRPEPSPRFQLRVPTTDYYGSASSLTRSSDFNFRGSTNSLSSTCSSANTSGTYQRTLKKRRAPLPPSMTASVDHLNVVPQRKNSNSSMVSDKSGQKSTSTSPRVGRKKRPAPKPPGQPTPVAAFEAKEINPDESLKSPPSFGSESREIVHSTPMKVNQSTADKTKYFTADGEKMSEIAQTTITEKSLRRIIPLDDQLLEDHQADVSMPPESEESVYYRRVIVPLVDEEELEGELGFSDDVKRSEEIRSSRQWEKVKQNKESDNRNRQSLVSNNSSDGTGEFDRFYNKSQHGKWKRRKGPAPSLPVPPKRVLQMLPLQDIKHELEVIEVQQQGLEKQGVQLEKMIREKTEGPDTGSNSQAEDSLSSALSTSNRNTKEVEDLIMQLFDLVVEKNELFRRQAELMYLRRQHRLEQEQADLEYEIRVLMAQPECNKTDSDKAKEEAMIARLVEVVKQRNEVVDSLEMDRLREAQEDLGIKQEIEKHTAKWDEEFSLKNQKPVKLSKKEKKTLKEEKKKLKNKKLDVDKDYDETETQAGDKSISSSSGSGTLEKLKKKKKKFLIL